MIDKVKLLQFVRQKIEHEVRAVRRGMAALENITNPLPVYAGHVAAQQHWLMTSALEGSGSHPSRKISGAYISPAESTKAKQVIRNYLEAIDPTNSYTRQFTNKLIDSLFILPFQSVVSSVMMMVGLIIFPGSWLALTGGLILSFLPLTITALGVKLADRFKIAREAEVLLGYDENMLIAVIDNFTIAEQLQIAELIINDYGRSNWDEAISEPPSLPPLETLFEGPEWGPIFIEPKAPLLSESKPK